MRPNRHARLPCLLGTQRVIATQHMWKVSASTLTSRGLPIYAAIFSASALVLRQYLSASMQGPWTCHGSNNAAMVDALAGTSMPVVFTGSCTPNRASLYISANWGVLQERTYSLLQGS